jgi:gliding motility-associated-like protein
MHNSLKKYLFFFFLQLYIFSNSVSYSQVNNDCIQIANTNRLVCGVATFNDNSNGTGSNDFNNGANGRGCLETGERQSAWYALKIRTAGTLTFSIIPNNSQNDYDFAIWGPFSNGDIAANCQSLGQPLRCNYSSISGTTGLNLSANNNSENANGSKFSRFIDVQAGQIYILLIDNFSQSNSGFSLVWNSLSLGGISGGGGSSTLAISTSNFSEPTITCNRVVFNNQSATCEGSLNYLWDFGDGLPPTSTNTERNPTYFYSTPGTYTVKLTTTVVSNTANNGTVEEFTRQITITGLAPTSASFVNLPNQVCVNAEPIPLAAVGTPSGGVSSFTIFPNGGNSGQIQNATTFNPALAGVGTHRINLRYASPTDANCVLQINQNVTVLPLPVASFVGLNDKYCIDNAALVTLNATPSGGEFRIQKQGENTSFVANSFLPANLGTGTHSIFYKYKDNNTCETIITKQVSIFPLPVLSNNIKPLYCLSVPSFTIQSSPPSSVFQINHTNTTTINPALLGVGVFQVTQTATDINNCTQTQTQTLTIVPQGIYTEEEKTLRICPKNTLGEELEILSLTEENDLLVLGKQIRYEWSNGTNQRNYFVRNENESGILIGLAIDEADCPVKKVTFNLNVECTPILFMPTAFSPNHDGLNDTWEIFGKEFHNLELKVFNRWGEVIFVTYNPKDVWDGTRLGITMPAGTYIWRASYENILRKGKKIFQEGNVTIVK